MFNFFIECYVPSKLAMDTEEQMPDPTFLSSAQMKLSTL